MVFDVYRSNEQKNVIQGHIIDTDLMIYKSDYVHDIQFVA